MRNMLLKDTFRDIKKSLGRFMSILIIISLGVAFFVGVKSSPLVMRATADKYYDDYNLMDIRLISTLGLTDGDIDEIRKIDGVEGVFGTYSSDVILNHNSREMVLKTHALDLNKLNNEDKDYINRVNVIEGRLPEKSGEVVIENIETLSDIKIGDTIKLESGLEKPLENTLEKTEYTVVGKVETPYYLSFEKGSSNLGAGVVNAFIMIPQEDFKSPAYSEAFITVKGAKELHSYKDEYFDVVDKVTTELEKIENKRTEKRYEEVTVGLPEAIASTINKPEWIILDRNSHYSYVDYGNAADSINAIAQVFPVFFFLVAALVCLTTMTRMVDEQRVNIGTLKALGYSKGAIASKFIIYALSASLIGSALGTLIGFSIFPAVVMDAYAMMYVLPPAVKLFDIGLVLMATLVSVAVTVLSAYLTVNKELKETPSSLMRPRAPKEGKRILIERIPFIWNRLNFIGKVTVRNIFRYKKRFFMTVFGIAGCTALLLTGFGIKDSIKTIADKQFGEINKYQLTINLDKNSVELQKKELGETILDDKRIEKFQFINTENGNIEKDDIKKPATILVPNNVDEMRDFISLQDRVSGEAINLSNNGVVITEKIASLLKIKDGDNITILNGNNEKTEVKVDGITENYVSNYIYMSPQYYNEVFGKEVKYNNIVSVLKEDVDEDVLIKDLITEAGISGVSSSTAFKDTFSDTVKSLNYVVLLMIISAGALAFVVLYNLTNVNISERMREIATIKVLGFYDKEVSAYIYRENIILTLIGTAVGLGLGVILHKFIMVTVEMENMMFGRIIDPGSYFISAILTILFAVLVNFAMYYKLKNVKMVESLKSVD